MPPAEKPKPSSIQEGFGFFFMSECEGRGYDFSLFARLHAAEIVSSLPADKCGG
ncbi:hypothetical protein PGN_1879 [Porphyromonas gingivalis ATCC 33277]|uniref:Uncharacterized protein n=1 Tax=Porphyromonas gingivalis (strain ATCC 33277 / DSM 20709 / CIP 103683 / JCM 12257 / NCTC 11834 / 2561) TaxID=431947 RepID=B2RM03_PORG3|nr:hypothetical protein PGN_1879 [Porphyromonas gingivalis ATCC 33277]